MAGRLSVPNAPLSPLPPAQVLRHLLLALRPLSSLQHIQPLGCPASHLFWPPGIILFYSPATPGNLSSYSTGLCLYGFAQEALSAGSAGNTPPIPSPGSFLLILSNPAQEPAFSESLSRFPVWSKFFSCAPVDLAKHPLHTVRHLSAAVSCTDWKLQTCLYFCIQVESNQPWSGSLRSGSVEVGQGTGCGWVETSWSGWRARSRAFTFPASCTCELACSS